MRLFRRKKQEPTISREQLYAARPVRNPYLKWERKEGGEVVISVPRDRSRKANVLAKLSNLPEYRQVQLDKIGGEVWMYCDGTRTFKDVMEILQERHRLSGRESEISLSLYMRKLMEKKFLALMVLGEKKESL
jgi:hypothetical protein